MKMRLTNKARTRKAAVRCFLRWALYSAALIFFFAIEGNPIIPNYCPLLLIPLATSVAMYEGDLACVFISLLSRFFVKKTFVSHLILNAGTCVIMALLDFVFLHWVWEGTQSAISFRKLILPAYGGAIFWSIPVYALVTLIVRKLRPKEQQRLAESAQNAEEQENAED